LITIAYRVVGLVLRCLADIEVKGMDRCPQRGPVLMAANHLSYFDVPLDGAWLPRQVIYFSKMEIKRWPIVGWIGTVHGTIYVRRGEADRQAIREALGALAAGELLGVFPEGHRSHGQGLLRAQPGIALLALRSGAPVWPVAVTGSEHMGKQWRPRVTLTGGEPFDPLGVARELYGPAPTHQDVADAIMTRIAALLPERYRGVYA
jgi:1-acyl-sn-glycerol-3-phosphate acyltransferase